MNNCHYSRQFQNSKASLAIFRNFCKIAHTDVDLKDSIKFIKKRLSVNYNRTFAF